MRRLAWLLVLCAAPIQADPTEGAVRLFTDDAIPRYLERGQQLARTERWRQMVTVLQRVIAGGKEVLPDLPETIRDFAVYSEDNVLYYPARALCVKRLAELPPEGLQVYRDEFDRQAKDLYTKALQATGLAVRLKRFMAVYDQYLPSSYGDDALEQAANINLSLGRYYEALSQFRMLLELYPKDSDRDLALCAAKSAYCAARIADDHTLTAILDELTANHAGKTVVIEGKRVAVTSLAGHPRFQLTHAARNGRNKDWLMAGGNASRTRIAEDLPDDIGPTPFWSRRIDERDPRITAEYGTWELTEHNRQPSPDPKSVSANLAWIAVRPYPTARPAIANGIMYLKDGNELIARSVLTGRILTGFARMEGNSRNLNSLHSIDSVRKDGSDPKVERAYRYLDYGGQSVTVSRGTVFLLEQLRRPQHLMSQTSKAGRPLNILSAKDPTGNLKWSWQPECGSVELFNDPSKRDAWKLDFNQHGRVHFRGPGIVVSDILYTVVHEEGVGVGVWAFDARTGRVLYRTPVHYKDELAGITPSDASISVAGGVAYVAANSGVIAAVDALPPGHVRWIRRYSRQLTRTGGRRGARHRFASMGFGHSEPVVTQGRVICAPSDSQHVFALDATTGKELWSRRRGSSGVGSPHIIVGVGKGIVFLAGEEVVAIDATTGKTVWTEPGKGTPFGRGFVGEKYVHIPINLPPERSAILRYSITDGTQPKELLFDVARLGNLVHVDGRLIVTNGEEMMVFLNQPAEKAKLAAATTVAELTERAHFALASQPPDREAARRDFAAARKLTTPKSGPDLLVAALENLFDLARTSPTESILEEMTAVAERIERENTDPRFPHPTRRFPYIAQVDYARVTALSKLGKGEEAMVALEHFVDTHGAVDKFKENSVIVGGAITRVGNAAAALYEELLENNETFRSAFEKRVRDQINAAIATKDIAALTQIPVRYHYRAPTGDCYFARADLLREQSRTADEGQALREFIREYKLHERRAEAFLRLADGLATQGKYSAAQALRNRVVLEMPNEVRRADLAQMLAKLDSLLPKGSSTLKAPKIRLPLASKRILARASGALAVRGAWPKDSRVRAILADESELTAIDAEGKTVWTAPFGAPNAAPPGGGEDPTTAIVSAAIHAARYAEIVDGDLYVGDVTGVMRVGLNDGQVKWRAPDDPVQATKDAQYCVELLRAQITTTQTEGSNGPRQEWLPNHVRSGKLIVRYHPRRGFEAVQLSDGTPKWVAATEGPLVGPPSVRGHLLAAGWERGATIYDVSNGTVLRNEPAPKGGALLAPPILDPLGRLLVVVSTGTDRDTGSLRILNAGNLRSAHDWTYKVKHRHAAVLHCDGKTVVFHNGGTAGGPGSESNLLVVDLASGSVIRTRTHKLFRDYRIMKSGDKLFVFTHCRGDAATGARLFRVDVRSGDPLKYDYPPEATVYGEPLMTARFIAITGSGSQGGNVVLYNREASTDSRNWYPVFHNTAVAEGRLLKLPAKGEPWYRSAPAVAEFGEALLVTGPFGAWELAATDQK